MIYERMTRSLFFEELTRIYDLYATRYENSSRRAHLHVYLDDKPHQELLTMYDNYPSLAQALIQTTVRPDEHCSHSKAYEAKNSRRQLWDPRRACERPSRTHHWQTRRYVRSSADMHVASLPLQGTEYCQNSSLVSKTETPKTSTFLRSRISRISHTDIRR